MTTPADHAATIREARAKIVAALNLTPLVPPQADTETMNVVEDAWAGLHELMDALLAQAETAEERIAENERITEMRRVEGERILAERDAAVQAAEHAQQALQQIAYEMPTTEFNPDGDEQAAYSMQAIARAALTGNTT